MGPESPRSLGDALTPREREVLLLIGAGKTSKEIAWQLRLSLHTVANHRRHIYAKLGLHSTAQAVVYALTQGG